jgi:spore germination protein KB
MIAMKKENISYRQLAILVSIFTIGSSIIIAPNMLAAHSEQDAWIASLAGWGVGLLLVWCFAMMSRLFDDKTLVEAIDLSFGKYVGFLVSFLFISFVIVLASVTLSNLGSFVVSRLLPGTPLVAVEYIYLITIVIAVRLGPETIARTVESTIFVFDILFLFFILATLQQVDVTNILPLFEHSPREILTSTAGYITFPFAELLVFLMLTPMISDHKKVKRGLLIGTFLGGLVLFIVILLSIFSIGGDNLSRFTYPAFHMAKRIDIAGTFQRMEVIMAGIWTFSIFTKLSVCVYVITFSIKQLFRLRDYRCLVTPICILLPPLSQFFVSNFAESATTIQISMMYFTYGILLIPFLTTGVWLLRFKRKKKSDGESDNDNENELPLSRGTT